MSAEFSPTILVVDDNRLVRELVRDAFADAGYQVITAEDGREALERLAEERVDLIVTDASMPGMDGWQLCERLKGDPQTRDIPLVFLSSEREVHHRLRGLRLGAYDYLCKPFSTEELLVRARLILERVRLGSAGGESRRSFLAGHTSHLPVPDLLQLLAINGKTGVLRLRGSEQGRIHLVDGRIVGAFTARTRGRKALFRMLGWTDADFHFEPGDGGDVGEPIEGNTQRLLMDAMVAIDDFARLAARLPPAEVPLTAGDAAERLVEQGQVPELARTILDEVREPRTLRDLLDRFDAPDVEIARAVAQLVESGALAPVSA
ncbi:MAG: hypothetical protein Kow0062_20490 [Acidobacteriota bacterium]|nr:MAG: response regulator [Acidobacteriota bacterium]